MEARTEIVESKLASGVTIRIQATALGGEERVAYGIPSFKEVTGAIEDIAQSVLATLKKAKPRRGSVEFGLAVGVESGKLTAMLMQGTGTANLKIILEWGEIDGSTTP